MRIYRASGFLFPGSYVLRVSLTGSCAALLPLITFAAVAIARGQWHWPTTAALVLATAAGCALSAVIVAGQLKPVEIATEQLQRLEEGKLGEALPEGGQDTAGRLLDHVAKLFRFSDLPVVPLPSESSTDELTGMYSRRGFLDQVDPRIRRGGGGGGGVLALVDVDRFQLVKDILGESEGERVLQIIAGRISENVRDGDIAARWNDEEFVIYFEGMNEADAMRILRRIHLDMLRRPPVRVMGGPVTVSFGVTPIPANGRQHVEDLLKSAARCVYEMKKLKQAA